jgi:hypothetical protein
MEEEVDGVELGVLESQQKSIDLFFMKPSLLGS